MKPPTSLVLLAFACLVASCNERKSHVAAAGSTAVDSPAAGYCLPASTAWAEEEYTQWMTRAELQYFQEQPPQGQYFAHVEGRNNAGLCEYRAVRRPLPTEQYVEAAVFWSLPDKDAFETELRLLRAGFVRKSMQVFVDASGNALHQIVWLRPAGTPPAQASPPPSPPNPPVPPPAIADSQSDATAPTEATAPTDATAPTEATPPADATAPAEMPPAATVVDPREAETGAEADAQRPQKVITYTVVAGDVLVKIARRQHTTVEAIMAANNLKTASLHIGQKLKIPTK